MKHKVIVALSAVALVVIILVSVGGYHGYLRAVAVENQRIDTARSQQQKADSQQQAAFQAGVTQLEKQCAADQKTYAALTPAAQAKTTAPDCTVNLVQ